MKIDVLNTPAYAELYRFIVYRVSMGACWFYGAYNDGDKAARVAAEIDGYVYDKGGDD